MLLWKLQLPMYESIAGGHAEGIFCQRLARLCSALRLEKTEQELHMPQRTDPIIIKVASELRRESERVIVPVTASTLLSMQRSQRLKPVTRVVVTLWTRMKRMRELLPMPYCGILKYSGFSIVKECDYDLQVDPSMYEEVPTMFDIDFKLLVQRSVRPEEKLASELSTNCISEYVTLRLAGESIKDAVEGAS